jgi:hypothetical protein
MDPYGTQSYELPNIKLPNFKPSGFLVRRHIGILYKTHHITSREQAYTAIAIGETSYYNVAAHFRVYSCSGLFDQRICRWAHSSIHPPSRSNNLANLYKEGEIYREGVVGSGPEGAGNVR